MNTNARMRRTALFSGAVLGLSLLGTVHAQPASALHPCNGLAITLQAVGNPTIGGPGDDVIGGTPDADVIDGGGGDDTICGWGGDDVLERGRRRLDLGR